MKKVLTVILTAVLCIATSVLPISALESKGFGSVDENYLPEGTPVIDVSSLTDPNGNYYLTGDIEITETIPVTFTGTLDGCGYTVTVSAPMFKTLSGTVKNLKIKGEVSGSSGDLGALACNVTGSTAKFENISNAANVTGTASAAVGGLIGRIDGTGTVFENIENTGTVESGQIAGGVIGRFTSSGGNDAVIVNNVHNTGNVTGKHRTGGICGYINNSLTATGLSNSGVITSDNTINNPQYAGGLFGFVGGGVASSIQSSVNNGAVNGKGGASAGGVVGYIEGSVTLNSCVNFGAISDDFQETDVSSFLGGLAGRISSFSGSIVKNCANFGDIAGSSTKALVGGIAGAIEKSTEITNCMNAADLSGRQVGGAVGQATGEVVSISLFINKGNITYQYGSPFIGYCGGISAHVLSNCVSIGEFTAGPSAVQLYVYNGNASCGVPTAVENVFCANVEKYCMADSAFPSEVTDCSGKTVSEVAEAANAAAGSDKGYLAIDDGELVLMSFCESHIDFDGDSDCDICGWVNPNTGDHSVSVTLLVCVALSAALGAVMVFIALRKKTIKSN